QHAHQKWIIHRDLKPSNVLVTLNDGRPVPKVIDFGVAKAINQRLTEKTLFTNFAQMVGTPLYMSPEQAEMSELDVDTRSDIYSLGVLLYELLTGTTPFDRQRMSEAAYDEIRRMIREEDPPRPSTRVSTLAKTRTGTAARRRADPKRLSQMLKGELDWVVMKALEKDRTLRYETANGLARDLQRYLSDQPVEACPPSALYRLRKFARRNRAAFATASLVTVALLLGIFGSTWQAIRATRAERLAETRLIAETKARTEADLAREAEADQRKQAEAQRAEAEKQRAAAEANLQRAKEAVDKYFTLVSESKLLDVPGLQLLRKELLDSALDFYKTLSVERVDDPALLAELAVTYLRVAEIDHAVDRNDDAIEAVDQGLAVVDRLLRDFPDAEQDHRRLAGYWKGYRRATTVTSMPKDPEAALRSIMRLMDVWRMLAQKYPDQSGFRSDLASLAYHTGDLLSTGGSPAESLPFFTEARALLEDLVRQRPETSEYRADLALTCQYQSRSLDAIGRDQDADEASLRALSLREQLVAEFPESPQHRADLGASLGQRRSFVAKRNPDEGLRYARRAIEVFEALAREYPDAVLYRIELFNATSRLLKAQLRSGREQYVADAVQRIDAWLSLQPPEPAAREGLAIEVRGVAQAVPQPEFRKLAEDLHRRALEMFIALSKDFPDYQGHRENIAHSLRDLGWLTRADGRTEDARDHFEQAATLFEELSAAAIPQRGGFYRDLHAGTLLELAKIPPGEHASEALDQTLSRAIGIYESLVAEFPDSEHFRLCLTNAFSSAGQVYAGLGRTVEAEGYFRRAIDRNPREFWPHRYFAEFLAQQERFAEAESELRAALEINPHAPLTCGLLADALDRQGKTEEAIAWALTAVESEPFNDDHVNRLGQLVGRDTEPTIPPELSDRVLKALASWYAARGQWAKATAGMAKRVEDHPDDHYAWYQLAFLYAVQSDTEGYRSHCQQMLERFGATQDPPTAERVAKACLIWPCGEDVALPVQMAERSVELAPDHAFRAYFDLARGLARYRAGDFRSAVESLDLAIAAKDRMEPSGHAMALVLKAMACERAGETQVAQAAMAEAESVCDALPKLENGDAPLPWNWHDRIGAELLRAEAATLLKNNISND
ncbi:MAG: hypothetical protein DWQ37_02840, partial [Planctomycetota bacterium]